MALLLNIDTATENASVCISDEKQILAYAANNSQQDHASWLHTSIAELLSNTALTLQQMKAVAVSHGPGSYTGLRVGLAAAKGFCYALDIPLITVGTLHMMAYAVQEEATELICPMIDARRMEVFTALYDTQMTELEKPSAMIINENSFQEIVSNQKLIFCGNGSKKLQEIFSHPNASFSANAATARHLAVLAHTSFIHHHFADLAYTEPLYVKEFYSAPRKPSI